MTFRDLVNDYRSRHDSADSLEDQIAVLAAHHWVGTTPDEPYLTGSEIGETLDQMGVELDCNRSTSVGNTDDDSVLSSFIPDDGPDWYVIRQRDGEFVMGDDTFPPAVQEECDRAIDYIQTMDPSAGGDTAVADGGEPPTNDDGQTLREVVSDELDEDPGDLEDYLQRGRAQERRSKLNEVVEIIESSEFDKPDTFDTIDLIPAARRYHFSSLAIHEYGLA